MSDSDEDKVLQTWLDLDAIQFPELPEVSQEPDYGALAGITADDWAVMISGGDPTEAAMGQQLARQARTIRRLRALADGYRDGLDDAIAKSKFVGARFERARIVAWLRGDCVHRDMGCDCHVIADAIERGEL